MEAASGAKWPQRSRLASHIMSLFKTVSTSIRETRLGDWHVEIILLDSEGGTTTGKAGKAVWSVEGASIEPGTNVWLQKKLSVLYFIGDTPHFQKRQKFRRITCEKGGNTEVLLHKLDIYRSFLRYDSAFICAKKIDRLYFMSRGPQFKFWNLPPVINLDDVHTYVGVVFRQFY